jgi:hypothetical protein
MVVNAFIKTIVHSEPQSSSQMYLGLSDGVGVGCAMQGVYGHDFPFQSGMKTAISLTENRKKDST